MSKDTQIWSGSRWQCRMSISKHFQLRYLILKFFRSEAHRVPGRIRLSPRSPHPRRLSSQVPRERSDGQEGPGVLMQDAGLPGQVLGSPPPPSQASRSQESPGCDWPLAAPSRSVQIFRAGMQTMERRAFSQAVSTQALF